MDPAVRPGLVRLLLAGALTLVGVPVAGAVAGVTQGAASAVELTPPDPAVLVPAALDPAVPDSRTAQEVFTGYVVQVGGYDVEVAMDWAQVCDQPDRGGQWAQGCVLFDQPEVIHLKDVPASLAASDVGRYVALHEYAHVLQARTGLAAVIAAGTPVYGAGNELEMSADCMAVLLGAVPGTFTPAYTGDCTGARGELAAAVIAGELG